MRQEVVTRAGFSMTELRGPRVREERPMVALGSQWRGGLARHRPWHSYGHEMVPDGSAETWDMPSRRWST